MGKKLTNETISQRAKTLYKILMGDGLERGTAHEIIMRHLQSAVNDAVEAWRRVDDSDQKKGAAD